jgi:UDP-glucose 4-epimerase
MAGIPAVAFDTLVSGHRDFVPASVRYIHASILHCDKVTQWLRITA